MSWEDELTMRILDPLEMFNTSFYHRRREREDFATPYDLARGRIDELDPEPGFNRGVEAITSSIAVCTTSSDISLWMKCLLSALISDDCKVVAQETVKMVTQEQVLAGDMFHSHIRRPRTPVSLIVDAYGMGWFTGYYRDRRLVLHYGSLPGAYTMLALVPDVDLGIFLSYNGAIQNDPFTINALLLTHLIDIGLGLPSWTADFDVCNFPTAAHFSPLTPAPSSVPPNASGAEFALRTRHPSHAYVGTYEHAVLGTVKVRHEQRRLRLSYGFIDADLVPLDEAATAADDEREELVAMPRSTGWTQMIDRFDVLFSRLEAGHDVRTFRHVTVPILNEGDSTFVRQGHHVHHKDTVSRLSAPSSSAEHRYCLGPWHPLSLLFLLQLLLLLTLQLQSS